MRPARVVALLLALAACSSPGRGQQGAPATSTTAAAAAPAPVPTAAPTTTRTTRPPPPVAPPVPSGPTDWTSGAWAPEGRPAGGGPAVLTTTLQPRTGGPTIGAALLDPTRLRFALYAGTQAPGGAWSNQGAVPAALWPNLVATFNSGFQFRSARGGFYADGRAAPTAPLRDGAASFVILQDGSATVGSWGRDVQPSANVAAVRQNLELLVDGGRPAANVATDIQPTWGFTLNGVVVNWRSAVGVDSTGRVLYVAGPGLLPSSLAAALISVGAVRAMELDINPAWPSFNTFTGDGAGLTGTKLLPGMSESPKRYLSPFARDFFAVFTR